MNWKQLQSIYDADVNVNLMVENAIQFKSWITLNIDVSLKILKNIMCEKKIAFGILQHVVVKMVNRF